MKKALYPIAAFCILIASAFTFAAAQNWKIAQGYSIKFSASGANGIFRDLKGDVVFDENNPSASKFNVVIAVSSINTGNGLKNTHAKGDKWFDASKFPEIKFTSTSVTKTGSGFTAKGELEMHGVKKEISLPFTFAPNGNGGTFNANFEVNRNDFGIGKPGGTVDDVIKLAVSVPVTK
jgi:polyisoprenoid-binding protein YceI